MGLEMIKLKFKGHDSGNCRVYATNGHKLYCLMGGELLTCSRDGEPSCHVPTDYELNGFTKAQIEAIEVIPGKAHHWDNQVMDFLGIERRTWDY